MRIDREKHYPIATASPPIAEAPDPVRAQYGRPLLLSAGLHAVLLWLLLAAPVHPPDPAPQGQAIEITLVAAGAVPPDKPASDRTSRPDRRRSDVPAQPVSSVHGSLAPQQAAALPEPLLPSFTVSPVDQPVVANDHPVPAPAVPISGPAAPEATDAQDMWEQAVLAQLERRKRYPAKAQRSGQQDIVYLRIVVDRAGRVLSSTVYRSARLALLDAAALDLVTRSSPLPPPPAALEGQQIEFVLPVEYRIRNNP